MHLSDEQGCQHLFRLVHAVKLEFAVVGSTIPCLLHGHYPDIHQHCIHLMCFLISAGKLHLPPQLVSSYASLFVHVCCRLTYGGSLIRPESTGFGTVYFCQEILKDQNSDFKVNNTVAF